MRPPGNRDYVAIQRRLHDARTLDIDEKLLRLCKLIVVGAPETVPVVPQAEKRIERTE